MCKARLTHHVHYGSELWRELMERRYPEWVVAQAVQDQEYMEKTGKDGLAMYEDYWRRRHARRLRKQGNQGNEAA